MKTITQDQLIDLLKDAWTKQQIISIDVRCKDNGLKKTFPGNAVKHSRIVGRLPGRDAAATYEKSVNRQREAEGLEPTFEAGTPNYQWIDNSPLAQGKDGLQLPLRPTGQGESHWYDQDGKEISYEEIKEHLKSKGSSANEKQGTEKVVHVNAPYVHNIISGRINHEEFVVSPKQETITSNA